MTSSSKKFKMAPSAGKVMAAVFWGHEWNDFGGNYGERNNNKLWDVHCFAAKTQEEHEARWWAQKMKDDLLLHGNARIHTNLLTREAMARLSLLDCTATPTNSPDVVPSDFRLFGPKKYTICGWKYRNDGEVIKEVKMWLWQTPQNFTNKGYRLVSRWQKRIEQDGVCLLY